MPEPDAVIHRSLRGIGPRLVTLYLTEIGGREEGPGLVIGPGWQARVAAGEPVRIGALQLGVTDVAISGAAGTAQQVLAAFEKKALRAGG